jgi:hypothetical protein
MSLFAFTVAESDFLVGRWEGGGTRIGPAFSDFSWARCRRRPVGRFGSPAPPCSVARKVGLDDGVTARQQLGILKVA